MPKPDPLEYGNYSVPSVLPPFLCPMCGHDTMRFAVIRNATYTAAKNIGKSVVVDDDEQPWFEAATCAACGVSVDPASEIEEAILSELLDKNILDLERESATFMVRDPSNGV